MQIYVTLFSVVQDQGMFALGGVNQSAYGWPCGWPHHLYLPKGRTGKQERFKAGQQYCTRRIKTEVEAKVKVKVGQH